MYRQTKPHVSSYKAGNLHDLATLGVFIALNLVYILILVSIVG